jgi:hypothetical protein
VPEADDPLRRLSFGGASSNIRDGASAMLAGDMAMRLRKTHGSSSQCDLTAVSGQRSLNEFPARMTMPPADRRRRRTPQILDQPEPRHMIRFR